MSDRFTITIDGEDYYVVPGTFVEGTVRRQAEFAYLGEEDLKSRPDTREFLHNSWIGGAQWEKPVYGRNNDNTYFESTDLSLTDRAGAVQQSAELIPLDSDLAGDPSAKLVAWTEDSVEGAITFYNSTGTTWQWAEWDDATNAFIDVASRTSTLASGSKVFASSGGSDGKVYALLDTGVVAYYDPTANTNSTFTTRSAGKGVVYNGAGMWVDKDFVWIYDGEDLYSYDIADSYAESIAAIVDDDDGIDRFSVGANFSTEALIPEWSCTRAIDTSEGIFYVKNVFEGGLSVAKVYRADKDATGSHILTPIGTLPKGQIAINIAHHLGSLLISTVPNFHKATKNTLHQKVTLYHVTGKSIGAVGSPLGGTNVDETPVWLLGTYNEMLYMGGSRRLWLYDGRVGAFHAVHEETDGKYFTKRSGFTQMVTVGSRNFNANGSAILFQHSSQDGLAASPYFEMLLEDSLITTADDTATLTSNWFDFDVPMETKTIYEVFYDSSNIRTSSTILIQISADGGAFATVAVLTGGTSANTARQAVAAPITGYKFQYKMVFSTDTNTSSAEPGRVYSLGFAAYAGEMVDVMQFTIDGDESMNYENNVQVPEDVYDTMAALRANREEVTVVHTYRQFDSDTEVTQSYRVMNVTGRKETPKDGMYEVQLVAVPS